jgi:hypothetical protein
MRKLDENAMRFAAIGVADEFPGSVVMVAGVEEGQVRKRSYVAATTPSPNAHVSKVRRAGVLLRGHSGAPARW